MTRAATAILTALSALVIAFPIVGSAVAQDRNSDPENPFGEPRRYQPNPGPGPAPAPSPNQPRRQLPPGGYIKPGGNQPNYRSIAEYMIGIWQWKNQQGRVYRAVFRRSGQVVAGAPGTGLVFVGIWRAQNRTLQMKFLRRCRLQPQQHCQQNPNQRIFTLQLQPASARVLRTSNGVWRRIR